MYIEIWISVKNIFITQLKSLIKANCSFLTIDEREFKTKLRAAQLGGGGGGGVGQISSLWRMTEVFLCVIWWYFYKLIIFIFYVITVTDSVDEKKICLPHHSILEASILESLLIRREGHFAHDEKLQRVVSF